MTDERESLADQRAVSSDTREVPARWPIRDLALSFEAAAGYSPLDVELQLCNLAALNVFIGVNNSGKSRLLRRLFASSKDRFTLTIGEQLSGFVEHARESIRNVEGKYFSNTFSAKLETLIEKLQVPDIIDEGADFLEPVRNLLHALTDSNVVTPAIAFGHDAGEVRRAYSELADDLTTKYASVAGGSPSPLNFLRIYIPALRGLRPIVAKDGSDNPFRDRTKTDYFPKQDYVAPGRQGRYFGQCERHDIFTGLEMYAWVEAFLRGGLDERARIADFQVYLSREFFAGQDVALIPRIDQDVLHVKIGNEEEQPIYNLGDGIQQIILLTLPMFLFRDRPLLLFIEEPELFLHPGMQRQLIDAFLNSPGLARQTFVASHSNHFLDITLDETRVSVYKFRKRPGDVAEPSVLPTFEVENVTGSDFHLLRDLGIRNSSVMLSNSTIWVEGITDRLYIRRYLEIMQRDRRTNYVEDLHYSFVEYGGACITHWSFLENDEPTIDVERLCAELILIADKDEGKEARHEKLRKALGDRFLLLPCREIENLLTPQVIRAVIHGYEGPTVELKDFQYHDYRDKKLGRFIDESAFADGRASGQPGDGERRRKYADQAGSVRDKLGFAQRAISQIKQKSDMSGEATELCTKILDFIVKRNPATGPKGAV